MLSNFTIGGVKSSEVALHADCPDHHAIPYYRD